MFFGKHQPVNVFAAEMPMAESQMGMPMAGGQMGMPGMYGAPEVSGYAHPGQFMHAGMPGFEAAGYAGPGMTESVHATRTEYDVPGCPPMHYGHTEFEFDVEPRTRQQVHIVRKGETVYRIAKHYGLDWKEVARCNHLGNPNLIYPGQRLLIPAHY
ncbi:MAG: LysM peptidoglycan-binding domain-containing protein [Desulfitobacteriaceae bacterium]